MLEALLDAVTLHKQRKVQLNITHFDMENLVIEVVKEAKLNGSVVLYQTVPLEGFWCRHLLKRALTNLLTNAQKYSFGKTSITINLSRFENRVLISVHNHGEPIPPETVGRIFQMLERLSDSVATSWGIGLPMVKLVAESHGGVVIVDSDMTRGTTFSLNLPMDCRSQDWVNSAI